MVNEFEHASRGDQDVETNEKRERSTIAFPYGDLAEAEAVARPVLDRGGGEAEYSQLAAWLGHETVNSGGFRLKVATARHFHLIETEGSTIRLSALGRAILDPERQRAARAQAFLSVPLYQQVFERYDGGLLPKDIGLENQMQTFGVAKKQVKKARQAMARSAENAGFFEAGRDRLVRPPTVGALPITPEVDLGENAHDDGPEHGGGEAGSIKTVLLRSGGQITVTVSVDLMQLSREDRTFVFKLIDELGEYEDASTPRQLSAGVSSEAASDTPATAEQVAG